MKSKTYKIYGSGNASYSRTVLLGILVYVILFGAGFLFIYLKNNIQTGQFVPGETFSGESFSRSLDLRIAANNKYPSDALSMVKDLGAIDGLKSQIISFNVPDDGLTEYGLMMLPPGKKPPQGYPTIILCHGYTSPRLYSTLISYRADMEFYAQHGFAVVKPDYRGQGYSSNEGSADSAYYSMKYNTDVMSLISALKKTNYIDRNNLNLWGHSMGAYISLRAAVLSPDIKNLILLSGPVSSLNKMYLSYIPPSDENNLEALKTRQQVFAKYGTPADNSGFWISASPISFVDKIKAHIQIHAGSLDQIVPPEFSADLDSALTKDKIKHDYYIYADGQHDLIAERTIIWARSLQVLQSKAGQVLPSA